jgi:hypothetical protein
MKIMKIILSVLIVVFYSGTALACTKMLAFDTGFKAIEIKLASTKVKKNNYTIEDRYAYWLILRKQSVYNENRKSILGNL